MAIRINVVKAEGEYDKGLSKMLGNPVLPADLVDALPSSVMFLMQIRLEDIKDLDEENILPHQGYLYFFLDTEDGAYNLKPIVIYYDGEPTHFIDGFNDIVDDFEQYNQDFLISFEKCEDEADGNKLLGYPADWQYQETSDRLLFQLDPLAGNEMDLFSTFDGFLYFFFDGENIDFDKVKLIEDIS